jgi:hypothetical protein
VRYSVGADAPAARLAGGRMSVIFNNAWYRVSRPTCARPVNPPPPRRSVVCGTMPSARSTFCCWPGLAVIVVLALVSPLESLRWWAGQSDEAVALAAPQSRPCRRP